MSWVLTSKPAVACLLVVLANVRLVVPAHRGPKVGRSPLGALARGCRPKSIVLHLNVLVITRLPTIHIVTFAVLALDLLGGVEK